MKKFILNILLFGLALIPMYMLVYSITNKALNYQNTDNTIFIWGDSQVYQGLDLEVLRKTTGMKTISYARHGAGVYDFLVFANEVPRNAPVIVGYSIPVLMRTKDFDYNKSNIHRSLIDLKRAGYTFNDIYKIMKKNGSHPKKISHNKHIMYDAAVNDISIPTSIREGVFEENPEYLDTKSNVYERALEILKRKNAKIIAVQFPYNSKLSTIIDASPANEELELIKESVSNEIFDNQTMVLDLKSESSLLFDYTHLNSRGAKLASTEIGNLVKSYQKPILVTITVNAGGQ